MCRHLFIKIYGDLPVYCSFLFILTNNKKRNKACLALLADCAFRTLEKIQIACHFAFSGEQFCIKSIYCDKESLNFYVFVFKRPFLFKGQGK